MSFSSALIRSLLKPETPRQRSVVFPARLNARDLLKADLPPRAQILDPVLTRGTLAMLYGPRGLGKTFVALGIAWAAASGKGFLKWRATRPHRVLYIDGEMAAVEMRERLRLLGPAPPTLDFLIADLHRNGLPDLARHDGQVALVRAWRETGRPELLVLDNLSSLVGFSRNDPDPWMAMQRFLTAMRRSGVAVLVVHHANKDGHQRGTSRREDVLDLVLAIRRPADYQPEQGARFELHFEKARGLLGRCRRADRGAHDDRQFRPAEVGLAAGAFRRTRPRGAAAQAGHEPGAGGARARHLAGQELSAAQAGGGEGFARVLRRALTAGRHMVGSRAGPAILPVKPAMAGLQPHDPRWGGSIGPEAPPRTIFAARSH